MLVLKAGIFQTIKNSLFTACKITFEMLVTNISIQMLIIKSKYFTQLTFLVLKQINKWFSLIAVVLKSVISRHSKMIKWNSLKSKKSHREAPFWHIFSSTCEIDKGTKQCFLIDILH